MRIHPLIQTVLLAVLTALPVHAQQTAQELFQSGLYAEEVQGDLARAIEMYGAVVEQFPDDRPLASRALLRLGGAYEKLGRAEARAAYERLVRDYSDQMAQLAAARDRLAALDAELQASAQTAPAPDASGLTLRRVWSGTSLHLDGTVSRDGRYILFRDDETRDLCVRDLTTGENRRITQNRDPSQGLQSSQISDDNRQIAYGWSMGNGVSELRVIGFDGSGARTLYRSEEMRHIDPDRWSADGKHILAELSRHDGKKTNRLARRSHLRQSCQLPPNRGPLYLQVRA